MKNLLMILRVFGQQQNIMIALFFLSWIDSLSKVEIWLYVHQKKVRLENCVFLELVCVTFKRQLSNARIPLKAYPASAGYDLYVAESKILKPREKERAP